MPPADDPRCGFVSLVQPGAAQGVVMAGRERERAELAAAVEQAERGNGRAVLLLGEPWATVIFATVHSLTAGIIVLIFYVVYQQFENHVLQVSIMSRTVNVNPLTVLISVLIGVELFGLLGALLSIPVAGIIQVVARDLDRY